MSLLALPRRFRDNRSMIQPFRFSRRHALTGLAAALAMPAIVTSARARQPIDAAREFGLDGNDQGDQSKRLQAAINAAAEDGRLLILPGSGYSVSNIEIPYGL